MTNHKIRVNGWHQSWLIIGTLVAFAGCQMTSELSSETDDSLSDFGGHISETRTQYFEKLGKLHYIGYDSQMNVHARLSVSGLGKPSKTYDLFMADSTPSNFQFTIHQLEEGTHLANKLMEIEPDCESIYDKCSHQIFVRPGESEENLTDDELLRIGLPKYEIFDEMSEIVLAATYPEIHKRDVSIDFVAKAKAARASKDDALYICLGIEFLGKMNAFPYPDRTRNAIISRAYEELTSFSRANKYTAIVAFSLLFAELSLFNYIVLTISGHSMFYLHDLDKVVSKAQEQYRERHKYNCN